MSYASSHMPMRQTSDPQQWIPPPTDTRQGQSSRYSPRLSPAQPGYHTPQIYEYDQSPYYSNNSFATFTPEQYPQRQPQPPQRRPQPYARTPSLTQQQQPQQQAPPFESPVMNFPMDLEPVTPATEEPQEKPPPRPPNAWILYRSDRLRDIADGLAMPGLESIKAGLGMSTDSGQKSLESSTEDAEGAGSADVKPKKKPKVKKGSKTPSEGILGLGKGKTGRGIPQADISKLISMMWARESETVKKEYDGMALRKKEEHALKYPDYKFQPQRRIDKVRMREERERQKQAAKQAKQEARQGSKPKRRGKSKPPPTSPYSTRPVRQHSGSGMEDHVVEWNKSQFLMNPFPFQGDALPSMHDTNPRQPPPHQQPIEIAAPAAPPPHLLPASYDQYGSYMPEIHVPGYGNAFAEAYVFEPLPLPGDDTFSFADFTSIPENGTMPDADSLAAIWCSIEEDAPGSSTADQFNIPSATSSNGLVDWNISAEQAINEWGTLAAPDMSGSVGEPMITDWSSIPYDPALGFISAPYVNLAGPSGSSSLPQALPPTPVSAPLVSAGSHNNSFDQNAHNQNVPQSVFLSASQPLSPVESSWSDARISSFSSAGVALGSMAHSPQPLPMRYVSSSAYPDTPLSVDTAGWSERTTSFGAMPPIHAALDLEGDSESLFGDGDEGTDERDSKSGYSSFDRMAMTPGNNSPAWGQPVPLSARSVSGFSDFSRRGSGVSGYSSTAPHSASVPAKSYVPAPPPQVQRIASTGSIPLALPLASSGHATPASYSNAPSPFLDASAPSSTPPIYVPHNPRAPRKARVVGHAYDTGSPYPPAHNSAKST